MYELFHFFIGFLFIMNSLLICFSNNAIHAILILILLFVTNSLYMLLVDMEFLALMFIIIYVGAIAILFLFVIMMLDIRITLTQTKLIQLFGLMAIVFILSYPILSYINQNNLFEIVDRFIFYKNNLLLIDQHSNIELLGQILFTDFNLSVLLIGILLLIPLIGTTILTMDFHHKTTEIHLKQLTRRPVHLLFF